MEFTYDEIIHFWNWVSGPVHGPAARARNFVAEKIRVIHDNIIQGRSSILEEAAEKDAESGKPIIENGKFKISEEKMEEARELLVKYLQTKVKIIDIEDKAAREAMRGVYDILRNSPFIGPGLNVAEGKVYDELLKKFEGSNS